MCLRASVSTGRAVLVRVEYSCGGTSVETECLVRSTDTGGTGWYLEWREVLRYLRTKYLRKPPYSFSAEGDHRYPNEAMGTRTPARSFESSRPKYTTKEHTTMNQERCDLVIVGAGYAGINALNAAASKATRSSFYHPSFVRH